MQLSRSCQTGRPSPSAAEPPKLECEAILRIAFAAGAEKDVLLEQARSVAAFARQRALKYAEQGTSYVANGGPFPDRLHLNLLIGRFLAEHLAALMRWSTGRSRKLTGGRE